MPSESVVVFPKMYCSNNQPTHRSHSNRYKVQYLPFQHCYRIYTFDCSNQNRRGSVLYPHWRRNFSFPKIVFALIRRSTNTLQLTLTKTNNTTSITIIIVISHQVRIAYKERAPISSLRMAQKSKSGSVKTIVAHTKTNNVCKKMVTFMARAFRFFYYFFQIVNRTPHLSQCYLVLLVVVLKII